MPSVIVLGSAWGLLAGALVAKSAGRAERRGRARRLVEAETGRRSDAVARGNRLVSAAADYGRTVSLPGAHAFTSVLRGISARRSARREDATFAAELPVVIDLLGVAVGAGCTPYLAIQVASTWAPPAVAARLCEVRDACHMGMGLADALAATGRSAPPMRPLLDALGATVRLGAPAGPVLHRLAVEARADVRRAAEARARTVPVRLLFPLVLCVLPAFGLLTVVPAVIAGLHPV